MEKYLIIVAIVLFVLIVISLFRPKKKNEDGKKKGTYGNFYLSQPWFKKAYEDEFGQKTNRFCIFTDTLLLSFVPWSGFNGVALDDEHRFRVFIEKDLVVFDILKYNYEERMLSSNPFDMGFKIKVRTSNDERLSFFGIQPKTHNGIKLCEEDSQEFISAFRKSLWVDIIFENAEIPAEVYKIRIEKHNFNTVYDAEFIDGLGIYYGNTLLCKFPDYEYVNDEKLLQDVKSSAEIKSILTQHPSLIPQEIKSVTYDEVAKRVEVDF